MFQIQHRAAGWRAFLKKWCALVLFCALPLPAQGQVEGEKADVDGDGLIEINSLTELHNMRYDLAGMSYKTSTESVGNRAGCPADGCFGYELMKNLDFNGNDNDGRTWEVAEDGSYSLDEDDNDDYYFPVADGGWRPIGDGDNPFAAVFDGNGHTISNLAISRDLTHVGLFARTTLAEAGRDSGIRNLGLINNLSDYTGSSEFTSIGGLVGEHSEGSITASYATGGAAAGGGGKEDYVGGLVGWQAGGSITASYAAAAAAGGNGGGDYVGGLVGRQTDGSITASWAAGDADGGGGGEDYVGGLVGYQSFGGSITASYATGDVAGGNGEFDAVGGLVGKQEENGSITASYATGAVNGGDGTDDVGGLVGFHSGGSITASYATGAVNGGDGDDNTVGGLVGYLIGSGLITASYGFGSLTGGTEGSDAPGRPPGVNTAAQLDEGNVVPTASWNSADNNTFGAWDFGTNTQIPALNYADYDGTGGVFDCGHFPANACGNPLPGQDDVSAGGPSAVGFGETVQLVGSLVFGRVPIVLWSWEQLQGPGPEVTLSLDGKAIETNFTAPASEGTLVFELTATDSDGLQYSDRISIDVAMKADRDGDGLIEIDNLLMLHNMRHNLAGTSYKASADSSGNSLGCPSDLCEGYELMLNLDFDSGNNGRTWLDNGDDGYNLDPVDNEDDYFPVAQGGWRPIGDEDNPFDAVFDGNTHTISNLAIRRDQTYVGLFGRTGSKAVVRNLGLIDNLSDYTGGDSFAFYIGGLVGQQSGGSITASYATGVAEGGDGNNDYVGGLVGEQSGGSIITASHATGVAEGGGGDIDHVGGLVGQQSGDSMIAASYATGTAAGVGIANSVGGLVGRQYYGGSITGSYALGAATSGIGGAVGGLVGWQIGGSITASHATGAATGGVGHGEAVGGLVGFQSNGSMITASYATGTARGGAGHNDSVGGLVGSQYDEHEDNENSITASYATGAAYGGSGDNDRVGGLVGHQSQYGPYGHNSITASYATGPADGGPGAKDKVGGLVGLQEGSNSITASYATASAAGGGGYEDRVGGLVGWQGGGSITASYATGDADGGDGNKDYAGGLVGGRRGDGSITASYATGDAYGGGGSSDYAGGLVGRRQGDDTITASYGFGGAAGERKGSAGSTKPPGVSVAAQLSETNVPLQAWNSAASNTRDAWDFGDETQIPALNHADYDDTGEVFVCAPDENTNSIQLPAGTCATLLPGQEDEVAASAGGPSVVAFGQIATLTGSLGFGRVPISIWGWQQTAGPSASLDDDKAREPTFTVPMTKEPLEFELTATDSDGQEYRDSLRIEIKVDRDGNRLIEIDSLAELHNLRYNLAGTSYKTGAGSTENNLGCPSGRCKGYELTRDLDFDGDDGDDGDDGSTWSGSADLGYILDEDDDQADYFPVEDGGWLPIGDAGSPFKATFDGNSHTISNLAIRRGLTYIGLFGRMQNAVIRNLGLIDNLSDYTGFSDDPVYIGGLVGYQINSSITASYATGDAAGGNGDFDYVGGLVGYQYQQGSGYSSITASYATGVAAGGNGDFDYVGGLVGRQEGGSITASYARGVTAGGKGDEDYVGGLVGFQEDGSITASYARGAAAGGNGGGDNVGGLVGWQGNGSITASYATGTADGGNGGGDYVGGLVGFQHGASAITASYAAGAVDGGDGDSDAVGELVGRGALTRTITASYGFGQVLGGELMGSAGSTRPLGVRTAAQLNETNTLSAWNSADSNTLGAWDFGTEMEIPALKYADYDGSTDSVFVCAPNDRLLGGIQFPACGTLLPDQDLQINAPPRYKGEEMLTVYESDVPPDVGVRTYTLTVADPDGGTNLLNPDELLLEVVGFAEEAMKVENLRYENDYFSLEAGAVESKVEYPGPDEAADGNSNSLVVGLTLTGKRATPQFDSVVVRLFGVSDGFNSFEQRLLVRVENVAPVFELEEIDSVAVFLEKSIPVTFFSDGSSGGSSGFSTVVVLKAPDDLVVKFDEEAGDYGAITLRRLSTKPGENGERSREVELAVLDGQGGRTLVTIDIERLAPLPEIEISEIQSHLLLLLPDQSLPLTASLEGGAVAGVVWSVEVSRGDSVEVNEINEQGLFTVTASSDKIGESELKLSAFDDNGRRRERSLPVVVAAAEAKPRLKLRVSARDPLDAAKTVTVSGFTVNDDIWIEAALEGAVPSVYGIGADLSFEIMIAKLGADGMPEEDVVLTATAQVEGGDGVPALRIGPVLVGAQMMAVLGLADGALVQVSIGHLVESEVSASVIAGDALLLQVLATAIVDSDNDGLNDAASDETEPDILGPVTAAVPENAVTVSLSLGDLARSLGLGGCGGVSLTLVVGADDRLTGCGDANLIDRVAVKTLTMTAQEQFGDGDYQLFDLSATFDSSGVDPGEFLVINLPVDQETHRVYRFDAETQMWVPVIGADLPGIGGQGGRGVGVIGVRDSIDDCETCFYALDVDRDGSVELLLLLVPLVPEDPSLAVDPSFRGRRIDIDAGDDVAPTLIPLLGLDGLTAAVTGNAYVEGRYIEEAAIGPAVELRGLKRTRNGPEQVVVEALDGNGDAVATITLEVSVGNQDPKIEFRLLSGELTTSIALRPDAETVLMVVISDPDGDTGFNLKLTGGRKLARLERRANPTTAVDFVGGDGVVINRLILTSKGARLPFELTLEATDLTDDSKSSGRLTVCVLDDKTGACPTPTPVVTDPGIDPGTDPSTDPEPVTDPDPDPVTDPDPDPGTASGSSDEGDIGSFDPWALVALALPLLLGRRRRKTKKEPYSHAVIPAKKNVTPAKAGAGIHPVPSFT